MRIHVQLIRILGFTVVVACAVSCRSNDAPKPFDPSQPTVDQVGSRELSHSQFPDIPVPEAFAFVNRGNASFSYERGGVRVARFFYAGPDGIEDVVDFYKRTMPLRAFDWQFLTEETPAERVAALSFKKGRQNCRINVSKEKAATVIQVDVTGSV